MDLAHPVERQAADAVRRLEAKGLVTSPTDAFSARMPGLAAMAFAPWGKGSAPVRVVRFDEASPAEPAVPLHAAVYRLRADAGAVLTARLPWASRLTCLPLPMPAVFDEQVRQLGAQVDRLPMEGTGLAGGFAALRERGGNAFLLDEGILAIGVTPERAVLNAELLEKCAKAYLLARLAGGRVHRIPWLVRFVAGRRLRRDERRAAEAWARGEMPGRFSTY